MATVTQQDQTALGFAMGPGGAAAAARILPAAGATQVSDGSTSVSGIVATELGSGPQRQTLLTLTNVALPITQDGSTAAYGGIVAYTFPTGNILVQGATASLTALGDSNFTSTFGSKFSMGHVTKDDATTFAAGTADLIAAVTASAAVAKLATWKGINTAAISPLDGNSSAIQAYLNALPTYANVSASGTLTVNGTILLTWTNLGTR